MSMKWEKIQSCEPRHEFANGAFYRSPVPGGWLLMIFWQMGHPGGPAMCFYPDPTHSWDGNSLTSAELMREPDKADHEAAHLSV